MNFYLSTDLKDPNWDAFVATASGGHLLQSTTWGQLKSAFGWQVLRVVGETNGRIVCGAQVLIRSTAGGPVLYVPRGPVLAPNDAALPALLAQLVAAGRDRGAIFLKIEPDWKDGTLPAGHLEAMGFRRSQQTIQPRATIVLDLQPDGDDILRRMKAKWRYNIRLAGRKGVQVRPATSEDLPAFYALLKITSRRDGFEVHSQAYYETVWRLFHAQGLAELLLASYEGDLLAGLMVFRFGDTAYYLYGASSDRHRNRMPNHLLQWRAIQWAREQGCTWYDFWGIPDEVADDASQDPEAAQGAPGMWGVYRFKQGFGGQIRRTVGAYDCVLRPAHYWLGTWVWSLLRRVKRLKVLR